MSSSRKRLGDWGERIAAEKLRADGYEIVAQNWRCAQGEIDIVARQQDEIAFVEVKTRRGRSHGTPEEAITPHKARKLLELAQWYCLEEDLDDDVAWRIDLMAVELDTSGKLLRCEHIVNIMLGW